MMARTKSLALVLALVAGTVQAGPAADPMAGIDLRRDVLQYHVSRGATPAQACDVVLRYFGGVCATDGATFTVADAPGQGATFYAVITLDR